MTQSLIVTAFSPLLNLKEAGKYKKLKKLAYYTLKRFPNLGYKLLRHFALTEFRKDFPVWLSKSASSKSKCRLKGRIDATKTGKKYGNRMPGLENLYDYVNGCHIKTHELFIFLVSIGSKDYIVDFHLVKRSERIGNNKLAQRMMKRFCKSLGILAKDFKHYCRFSLDGAWGNGETMDYFNNKGYHYPVAKSGGRNKVIYKGLTLSLKDLEKKLAVTALFKGFNDSHRLRGDYSAVNARLWSSDLVIRVVLRRFPSKRKKSGYRYLMLLSANTEIYDYQIAQCYEGRWGIEECIKESKQVVYLTKYSFHSETTTNIEMFLALRLSCLMILNWYRVEYCRPSQTSIWKVARRFENHFTKMSYKALWKLFST